MRIKSVINLVCYFSVLAIVIAGASSCKKSNNASSSSVQVINASTDAGPINFYLSGNLKTTTPVSYGNTSGYFSAITGNQTEEIKTIPNSPTVVSTSINLTQDAHYSIFLCGQLTATLGSIVVQDDLSAPTSGTAKVRCVNTVPNSNVEFTLMSTEVLFYKDVAYKTATDFRDKVIPGTYSITVSPYGPAYTTPGVNLTFATENLTFVSGKIYTIYFKGELGPTAGAAKMDLGVLTHN